MKLILDENLPPSSLLPSESRQPTGEISAIIGDPDETLFDYACEHDAVIVSQDLDFTRMLALRGTRLPSVIQLRVQCPTPDIIGPALLSVIENHRDQLREGCLISLDLKRHRLRLLPLN